MLSEQPQESSDTPFCFTPTPPHRLDPVALPPKPMHPKSIHLSIHGQVTVPHPITVTPSQQASGSPGPSKACLPPTSQIASLPTPCTSTHSHPPMASQRHRVKPEFRAVPHHLALPPSPISSTPSYPLHPGHTYSRPVHPQDLVCPWYISSQILATPRIQSSAQMHFC